MGFSSMHLASILFPTREFEMVAADFPATFCFSEYEERGEFYLSFIAYDNGKRFGELHSNKVSELGNFRVELADMFRYFPPGKSGLIKIEYTHPEKIPVSMYLSSVHRKSGTYISIPALPYMGDDMISRFHDETLENTLFWPGVLSSDATEPVMIVLNPYGQVFSYQLSLFLADGTRVLSEIYKIRPNCSVTHELNSVFEEHRNAFARDGDRCTVCVSAQFKVVAYGCMRDRATGAPIMIDHLHHYRFF